MSHTFQLAKGKITFEEEGKLQIEDEIRKENRMKRIGLLCLLTGLFLIKSGNTQAQTITSNTEQKQIELLEFMLSELDSIQAFHPGLTYLTIEIKIDDFTSILKEVNYYSQLDSLHAIRVNGWPTLTKKIHDLYFFNPSFDDPDLSALSYTRFDVPLNRHAIKKYLKDLQTEKLAYSGEIIKPNTNFTLKLDEFEFHPEYKDSTSIHLTNFKLCSKLEGLNSEVIKIHENYYLFFKVISTSNNGYLESKIVLSIYYIHKNKTYFLEEFDLTTIGQGEYFNSSSAKSSTNHGEEKELFKLKCTVNFD